MPEAGGGLLEFPRDRELRRNEIVFCWGPLRARKYREHGGRDLIYPIRCQVMPPGAWSCNNRSGASRLAPFVANALVVFTRTPRWSRLRLSYLIPCIGVLL